MPASDKQQLSEQLDLTRKLAAATAQMAGDSKRVADSLETQTSKLREMNEALGDIDVDSVGGKFESLEGSVTRSLRGVDKAVAGSSDSAGGLQKRFVALGQQIERKFPKSAAIAAGALSGLAQGVKNVIAIGHASGSMFVGLVGWITDVTAAILAIPLKIFQGLINMAQNMGGMDELRQALENIRKEFGALRGPAASAIIDVSRSMKNFTQTGLSAFQVFGMLHERLDHLRELAVAMGPTFNLLLGEFRDNGGALLAYQKGLGLSGEQMRDMSAVSISTGRRLESFLRDNTKYALDLGKAFALDSKLISRDMAKAFGDVRHFAGATVREIAQASVYARKLGVELDKITGTLDTFETFDSAAESAAKLGQSFGVLVDSYQLMNAQDPATQVEMLRKQLAGAGVDTANMTRQQLKLLSQTTGLDEATAKMVFSLKNQGMSLSEIQKKGGDVERKQVTQAEAMSRLSDAIERLVRSGQAMQGGFFDVFLKGFFGGIQGSREFLKIMMNIRAALRTVYFEGVKLGRAFVQVFPGVKDFFGTLASFFEPSKFRNLAGGVTKVFTQFFSDLTKGDGPASFSSLMGRIREAFFDFFDSQSSPGRRLLDGFRTMMRALAKVAAGGIAWVGDAVADGIRFVIDLLSGKKDLSSLAGSGTGALGFTAEILTPMAKALAGAWPKLRDATLDLLKTVGSKIVEYVKSPEFAALVRPVAPALAFVLFGPAVTRALAAAATDAIARGAIGALTGRGASAVASRVAAASSSVDAAGRAAGNGAAGATALTGVAAQGKAAGSAIASTTGWGVKDAARLGLKLVAIAGALAVGGVMLAYAAKHVIGVLGSVSVEQALASMVALGSIAVASLPVLLATKLLGSAAKPADVIKGGLLVSLLGGMVGGVTFIVSSMLGGFTPEQLRATGDLMLRMTGVFLGMIPLLVASAAIGMLLSGPQGLAIGGLAAGGFAVVSTAVIAVAGVAESVVERISALKIDSSFGTKIDAFLGVMRTIQAFADSMIRIAEIAKPSFTQLIAGDGASFSDNLSSVGDLVESIVKGSDGRGGILGIMTAVEGSIDRLGKMSKSSLESAKVLTDVMGGLAEIIRAVTPPPEYYEAATGFIQQLSGGDQFGIIAADVSYYAKQMLDHGKQMLESMKSIVVELSKVELPSDKLERVKGLAGILSSVMGVVKGIMPSPEVVKSFVTASTSSVPLVDVGKTTSSHLDAKALAQFMGDSISKVKELIPILTDGALKSVVDAARGIKPDEIERVKVVGNIVSSVAGLVSSIASSTKSGDVSVTADKGAIVNIQRTTQSASVVLSQIAEALPGVMVSLQAVVKNVPTDAAFGKGIANASAAFGFLAEIPKLSSALKTAVEAGGETSKQGIDKATADLAMHATFLQDAAATIKSGAIVTAMKAVEGMLKTANELDSALSDGNVAKLNVAAKLQNVAKAVGLGGSAKYTITNKNVVVHVDITVSMKADEFERVLIQRKSSVIRDRLNNAQYDGSSKPSAIPGEPNAPSPALIE